MQVILVAVVLAGFLEYTDALQSAPVLTVRLAYFSGRRNPKWDITPSTPNYAKITQLYNAAKAGKAIFLPTNMPAKLGYRGFLVSENAKVRPGLILGSKTKDLQKLLLQSAQKPPLSPKVIEKVTKSIEKGVEPLMTGRMKRVAPDYPDATWNAADVVGCNNCYNYATNRKSPLGFGIAVPGLGGGQRHDNGFLTANDVRDAAVRDGLQVALPGLGDTIPLPKQAGHLVALVVAPGVRDSARDAEDGDFHWYRLDSNNRWSHKEGESPISNEDGEDKEINDPRKAKNDPLGPSPRNQRI
ncbi:hypothetical protein QZH41_001738 [Actinostola sp. cb2023]|nr:hypothetical protein QZH41_001738 [Actinostola sp. cb2023]